VALHRRRSSAPPHEAPLDRRQAPGYVPPPPAPVSWDVFLAWLDEGVRAEWVDGEIIEMPPVRDDHQFILGFIYRLIMEIVDARQLGAVYLAPFVMHLPSRPSGREPDLLFVSIANLRRATPTYIDGPADLVVEIISPDSVTRDRRDKLTEYQAAGVPEYWIVDPRRKVAQFFLLGDDGTYHPGPIDAEGIYRSPALPGFRMRVSWLWQTPLPTLAAALADLPE
jgi:Uma2 family endonuclease